MPELLRMPEIAAAQTSAVLASWPVAVGKDFCTGDVIATVETDKAVVDVEADGDGVLLRTLVAAGTEVEVGTPIALLAAPAEQVDDIDAVLAQLGVTAPATGDDAGPVAGSRPIASNGAAPAPPSGDGDGRRFASPLARRLAAEAGLQVTDLVGTGPGGRIVRRDVEAALAQRVATEEAEVHAASPAATPAGGPSRPVGGSEAVPEPPVRLPAPPDARYTDP